MEPSPRKWSQSLIRGNSLRGVPTIGISLGTFWCLDLWSLTGGGRTWKLHCTALEVSLYKAKILNHWSAFCSCWLLLAYSLQGSPSASKILQTVNGFSEMQLRILHIWTRFPQLQTVFLSWPNFPRRRPNKYRYQSSKRQVHLPALKLRPSE